MQVKLRFPRLGRRSLCIFTCNLHRVADLGEAWQAESVFFIAWPHLLCIFICNLHSLAVLGEAWQA